MQRVKQTVKLIKQQEYEDILQHIENCGRTCYQSEPKGEPESFIRKLITMEHDSVLEHVSMTFDIVTSRNITHELVRHRLSSYSQESTRYIRYGNVRYIAPPCIYDDELERNEKQYLELIQIGVPPQDARDVLFGCVATNIKVTMNLRQLRTFLKTRLRSGNHPMMRKLAWDMLRVLKLHYPIFVEDLWGLYRDITLVDVY